MSSNDITIIVRHNEIVPCKAARVHRPNAQRLDVTNVNSLARRELLEVISQDGYFAVLPEQADVVHVGDCVTVIDARRKVMYEAIVNGRYNALIPDKDGIMDALVVIYEFASCGSIYTPKGRNAWLRARYT